MNKATELISGEHRQVEELFDRFLRQPERATAIELCAMLERHTEMEEHVLYPELRAVDEELYADAKQEHEEADQLIQQIRQSHNLDQMTGLVRQLQASVQHHVEDEEGEDLPRMERSCGTARMDDLGEQMRQFRQRHGEVHTSTSTMPSTPATSSVSSDGAGAAPAPGSSADGADKEALLDLTKDELYEKAKEADIPGRSSMNKDELAEELANR